MNIKYDKDDIQSILALVRDNPNGFLRLANKYCTTVSQAEIKQSMRAWNIDFEDKVNENNPGNRSSG